MMRLILWLLGMVNSRIEKDLTRVDRMRLESEEDRRVFLILFDDYDKRPMIVTGEATARAAFRRVSDNWNAHLFAKIASNSRDDARANDNSTLAGVGRD
jgi:hypothetical protein